MKRKAQDEPPSALGSTPKKLRTLIDDNHFDELDGSPTPKAKANPRTPQKTPRKSLGKGKSKADRSAKRKSAAAILEARPDEDDPLDTALAERILESSEDEGENLEARNGHVAEAAEAEAEDEVGFAVDQDLANLAASALEETPSKKGRGRPKGSKNKRSPTPEGDLPPEERYFFQNRFGPPEVSSNTLASLKLLSHEEYFDLTKTYVDPHAEEIEYLADLHRRAYPQWRFELNCSLGVCLYGWGSKRGIVSGFAEWLHQRAAKEGRPAPTILVVNGHTSRLNVRNFLNLLARVVLGDKDGSVKLGVRPADVCDTLLAHLDAHPSAAPITVLINSIDAPALRRSATQTILSRLAAHARIHLLATADTPTFPLLWDANMRDRFVFIFHDCTTFAPYDRELNVVDDVHDLLGRKGRRVGGGEGIGFVLRSLTENSRRLYVLLLTEILAVMGDGGLGEMGNDERMNEEDEGRKGATPKAGRPGRVQEGEGEIGVEYKTLYQKASENFVCSSEMNFRTLLKEFYDHQMIVSRKDGLGSEILGVPLSKEEMEALLEELVMAGS